MPTPARKPKPCTTRINEQLRKQGRDERLVRGRGYYYLTGGDAVTLPSSMICSYRLEPSDYAYTASEVVALFAAGGIAVAFDAP